MQYLEKIKVQVRSEVISEVSLRYKRDDLEILPKPEFRSSSMCNQLHQINFLLVVNIIFMLTLFSTISDHAAAFPPRRG